MQSSRSNKTPFCRVCFNAGESSEVYSSHYTKDFSKNSKGIIVCPLILQSECSYCHKKGHWKKYCTVLKRRNKEYMKRTTQSLDENDFPNLTSENLNALNQTPMLSRGLAKIMPIMDDESDIVTPVTPQKTIQNDNGLCYAPMKIKKIINWADYSSDED